MTHCTTWHVRIDLVDDGDDVMARAELIGAPSAMMREPAGSPHDDCADSGRDAEDLSAWRSIEELAPTLAGVLSNEHREHLPPVTG